MRRRATDQRSGTAPGRVDTRAIQVMRVAGVDISGHHSKHFEELIGVDLDWVVTVCDNANESCPVFPGRAHRLHAGFDDPPRLPKPNRAARGGKGSFRFCLDRDVTIEGPLRVFHPVWRTVTDRTGDRRLPLIGPPLNEDRAGRPD